MRYSVLFVLALCSIFAAADPSLDELWEAYKLKFNKIYADANEDSTRRHTWEGNYRMVEQHNREYAQGQQTYSTGINGLSDLSRQEILRMTGSREKSIGSFDFGPECNKHPKPKDDSSTPKVYCAYKTEPEKCSNKEMNYEDYCEPIQNQGQCASCWSFSATGTMECQYTYETGNKKLLSSQQLVDCVERNTGCCGGQTINAFVYAQQEGVMTAADYGPYTEKQGPCKPKNDNGEKLKVAHILRINPNDETMMFDYVCKHGVLSSSLDVASNLWQFTHYKEGVFTSKNCTKKTDHAIVVVGYGMGERSPNTPGESLPYWLCRNSWGDKRQDHGMFKIYRGSNMCGIAKNAIGVTYNKDFCPKQLHDH